MVTVELNVDVGPALAGPAVFGWFDGAVNTIARPLLARLAEREVEPAAVERVGPAAYGGPAGAVWAHMQSPELGSVGYSVEYHRRFFDELPDSDGSCIFSIGVAAPIAGTFNPSPPSVQVSFIRHPWGRRLGRFEVITQLPLLDAGPDGGETVLLTMINDMAERFAVVGDSVRIRLPDGWRERIWIGFLEDRLGERLGGIEGLRQTGHFVDVRRASAGGYLVQTTAHLADLTHDTEAQAPDHWWRGLLEEQRKAEKNYMTEPPA
ncbi:hypothetical protein ACQEVZ_28685 [Dactylosporangium sp. CA-152071]|uniref:hypothetical protein n=1 Tax=Dactylosporangium sp. CA-152071 TaxID=3239933 RepID=UPI003D94D3F2